MVKTLLFTLILFISSLSAESQDNCLDSDYRYLLQRAWDEANNNQFIDRATAYLDKYSRSHPVCIPTYEKEKNQNQLKKNALKFINTNTYPFLVTFSEEHKNHKYFTEGIQVAIEDGLSELKTIMEKLVIREGQVPIFFLIDFEDEKLPLELENKKRELYFSYLFKNIEGIYFYAPYNRVEHNEFFEDIPLNGKALEGAALNKIYSRVMKSDNWQRLYIIRLIEKKILIHNDIYRNYSKIDKNPNQSFITLDLFKVTGPQNSNETLNLQLIASADVTGVRTDFYYNPLEIIWVGFSIFLIITISLFKIINNENNKNYFQLNSNNSLLNYFLIMITISIIIFFVTSFTFPYNRLFHYIIGEWLDVSSRASYIFLNIAVALYIVILLFLCYILSNKFIDSSFILKNPFGLPTLYGSMSYGMVLAISYKIIVYENFYKIFHFSDLSRFNNYYYLFLIMIFILPFIMMGHLIQKKMKINSLEKNKKLQLEKFNNKSHLRIDQLKFTLKVLLLLKILIAICILVILGFVDLLIIQILKSEIDELHSLYENVALRSFAGLSFVLYGIIIIKDSIMVYENKSPVFEVGIKKIDSESRFKEYFKTKNDEFRFRYNQSPFKFNDSYYFIRGDDKSGKKEIVKRIIRKIDYKYRRKVKLFNNISNKYNLNSILRKLYTLFYNKKVNGSRPKIININFSDKLNEENELSKFIEIGKFIIPDISYLHSSKKIGDDIEKNSRGRIVEFIEEIPFIGKLLNKIISFDRFIDEKEIINNIRSEVTRIYIDYINSHLKKNRNFNSVILVFENIHNANEFSFQVILNLMNEIIKSSEKSQKMKIYVILTGRFENLKLKPNIKVQFDLSDYILNINKKISLPNKINSKFNFRLLETNGFNQEKITDFMRDKFSFARTPKNDYFIEKLFYIIKLKDKINLYDINMILRSMMFDSNSLFKFNTKNKKIYINKLVDNIIFPEELYNQLKNNFDLLNSEEKIIVIASTQLHDWFTLDQLSSIVEWNNKDLNFILYNISEKIPDLYLFNNLKYIRINKRMREYILTKVLVNFKNISVNNIFLQSIAMNYIKNFKVNPDLSIIDYKKLSSFSFYTNNPNQTVLLSSYYIREAYFNQSDRFKVFSVFDKILDRMNSENLRKCDTETENFLLYLISIHNNFRKIVKKDLYDKFKYIMENKDNNPNSIPYKNLAILIIKTDPILDKKLNFDEKIIQIKIEKISKTITKNFNNMLEVISENKFIKSWVLYFITFFAGNYILVENKYEKVIYKEILNGIRKKYPDIVDKINFINSENDNKIPFYGLIHDYCLDEINFIINEMKNNRSSSFKSVYDELNHTIEIKEILNLKVRMMNFYFNIVLNDFLKNDLYKENLDLINKLNYQFEDILTISKSINNLGEMGVTNRLYSKFYLLIESFKKSEYFINESVNLFERINDYEELRISLYMRIQILEKEIEYLDKSKDYNQKEFNKKLQNLKDYKEEIKQIESENFNVSNE